MAKLSEYLQSYLYQKFPTIYRKFDADGVLERFVYALTDPSIELVKSIEKLPELLTTSDCPEWAVHTFYSNFGGEFYAGLDVEYQRKLLTLIVDILRVRGTETGLSYIVEQFSGVTTTIRPRPGGEAYEIDVVLNIGSMSKYREKFSVVRKLINDFLPFYVNAVVIESYLFDNDKENVYVGQAMYMCTSISPSSVPTFPDPVADVEVLVYPDNAAVVCGDSLFTLRR